MTKRPNQLAYNNMADQGNILSGPDTVEFDTGIGIVPKIFNNLQEATNKAFYINIDTEETITYKQLWNASIRVASALQTLGLGFQKILLIVGEADLEVLSTFFGAIFTGALVGCVNPTFKSGEIKQLLTLLRPDFIFCSKETFSEYKLTVEGIEKTPILISPDATDPYLNYRDLLTYDPHAFHLPELESWDEHIICIFFSSGTTGLPKGAKIKDKSLQYFLRGQQQLKVRMSQFPICVASTVGFVVSCAMTSGTFISGGKSNAAIINGLRKYKPTLWFNSPSSLLRLAQEPNISYEDFSSVQYLVSSGACLTRDQIIYLNKKLFDNRIGINNSYASVETLTITTMANECNRVNSPKIGSVGKLQPLLHLKVIHTESGEVLGPNCEGEFYVKTPFVMAGYINCPKETAEALDAEGWYRTGDLGYYDEDGYVYISGRAKEIFKCMNRQVSPMQLEAIVQEHPAVHEAAVAGKPHPIDGYHPTAFVVLKENVQVDANDIAKFVNDKVADYRKLYGGVYFVQEIPKNASGKKMRTKLLKTILT